MHIGSMIASALLVICLVSLSANHAQYSSSSRATLLTRQGLGLKDATEDGHEGHQTRHHATSAEVARVVGSHGQQHFNERQLAMTNPALPTNFSWQTYLLYHPDLRSYGIRTQQQAEAHFIHQGRREGRLYKPVNLLLRYSACDGFINQHYAHISAVALAAALGAEIMLPVGCRRNSYGTTFNVDKTKSNMKWFSTPLNSTHDVNYIISYWASRGLTIHEAPVVKYGLPLPLEESTAFPDYGESLMQPDTVVRLEHVYMMNYDMSELVEKVRSVVVGTAGRLLRDDPSRQLDRMTLDLPCTFFCLRTLSNLPLVTEVAGSLKFAPHLHRMAARVLDGVRQKYSEFNAAHLRIEKDAQDWIDILGGPEKTWALYLDAMRRAQFSSQLPMFVASGLLTYGSNQEDMRRIVELLKHEGLCSDVLHKELYISEQELEQLTTEQKALLDFLVLAEGRAFVGLGASTFAYFIREYRALQGIAKSSTALVDSSRIGTDALFHSAAQVI